MGYATTRVFGDGTYPLVTLAGEEYVRPLAFGTSWNTIKISMLCALTPVPIGAPATFTGLDFFCGVCSYGGGSWASSSCASAVGTSFASASYPGTATWNGGSSYYSLSNASLGWRINGVRTSSATNAIAAAAFPHLGKRWMWSAYLTKGVSVLAYAGCCPSTSGNWTLSNLFDYAELTSTTPTIYVQGSAVITVAGSAAVPVVSDTAGPLNALNLYWNNQAPLEIYGIAVARLS